MYTHKPDFETWKQQVIRELRNCKWYEHAIQSIDWNAFKEYYDDDLEPHEAVKEEEKSFV